MTQEIKNNDKELVISKLKPLLNIEDYSPIDIYVAINEAELTHEDWALVISTLNKEDLNAITALHSWNKYDFIPESYTEILDYVIYDKNRLRAYKHLQKLSYDELVLFLSKTIRLEWFIEDKEYSDDAYVTEDKVFVIYKKEDNISDVILNKAIHTISLAYFDNMIFGRKLCLDLMATSSLLKEEELLHKKDYILETLGIKTYQETMELYHYESPTRILKKISKKTQNQKNLKYSFDEDMMSKLPKIIKSTKFDINFDLESIENMDEINLEFYTILNSIIAYNNVLKFGEKTIRETIKRNLSYLKLGMNIASKIDDTDIKKLLSHIKLSEIFRLGFSSIIEIKRYASTIKALIKNSPKSILLNVEEENFINNMTKTIPLIKTDKLRPIESTEELKFAKEYIDTIKEKLA